MRTRIGLAMAIVAVLLLPAVFAFGRGGGGGGGGGGGHGGGGGGGGRGGGGMSRGGSGMSSNHGSFSGGNPATNRQSFTKNNFSKSGAVNHQVNRLNSGLSRSALGNNAFVHSQKIANGNFNQHWNNNWNHWGWHNGFFFNPWWGYGGFGWWGFGFGWPYYYYGYGSGYPMAGCACYGYADDGGYGYALADATDAAAPEAAAGALTAADGEQPGPAVQSDPASASAFIDQGEIDFKAGRYQAAARDWQHALVDDPKNGGVMMLMAQTLFALGQYDDAAGATQAAMQMLPEDKWGVVVTNYKQLYGNVQQYTDQLKALEKARDAKPEMPALHFLLGFHFGYLNFPKNAVRELDKTLTLAPKDLGAFKLRGIFAAQWSEAPPVPQAAADAAAEAIKAHGGAKSPAGRPAGAKPPAPSPPGPSDAEKAGESS